MINVKHCLIALLLLCNFLHGQTVFHVTNIGSETASGLSWTESISLEHALNIATDNDEIWLKEGNYSITSTLTVNVNNLSIYGGFAGNETQIDQRDWVNNLTILDGNNNFRIADIENPYVTIDGITFQNGNSSLLSGGAVFISGSAFNTTLQNCTFQNNHSDNGGGAIFSSKITMLQNFRTYNS